MTTRPYITTAGPASKPARTRADGPWPDAHENEPEWPITTWQGWEDFATTPPPTPPQPGDAPRSTEERLAYHSAFVTVRTPATQVRTLMLLGRHQQTTARPSLIVTGPAAAGKTTALLEVGRTCHLAHTRKHPAPPGRTHQQVPVAYLLVRPGATAKTLATEFARYLGIPVTTRMTQAQITSAVCHTYTQAGVRLVLIDEIHRLNPRTPPPAPKLLTSSKTSPNASERPSSTPASTSPPHPCSAAYAAPNPPAAQASSPAAPSPPATARPVPSPTSSPTWRTPST